MLLLSIISVMIMTVVKNIRPTSLGMYMGPPASNWVASVLRTGDQTGPKFGLGYRILSVLDRNLNTRIVTRPELRPT